MLSYGENIRDSYFLKFGWAAQTCDFLDSILKDDLKFIKSSQSITEYYNALELACKSYGCIADMTDGITKRYDKTAQVRIERAYKFTFKDRHKWDDNAFARLYILFIRLKGKFVQLKGSYFGNNIN